MVVNTPLKELPMSSRVGRAAAIRQFILDNVGEHPKDIGTLTARQFGVSRQSVTKHLRALIDDGLLEATGRTRARKYYTKSLLPKRFTL